MKNLVYFLIILTFSCNSTSNEIKKKEIKRTNTLRQNIVLGFGTDTSKIDMINNINRLIDSKILFNTFLEENEIDDKKVNSVIMDSLTEYGNPDVPRITIGKINILNILFSVELYFQNNKIHEIEYYGSLNKNDSTIQYRNKLKEDFIELFELKYGNCIKYTDGYNGNYYDELFEWRVDNIFISILSKKDMERFSYDFEVNYEVTGAPNFKIYEKSDNEINENTFLKSYLNM